MAYLNENYLKLQAGYLFPEIARRVKEFCEANPEAAKRLIRCGIGDVTEPLPAGGGNGDERGGGRAGACAKPFAATGPSKVTNFCASKIAQIDYRDRGIEIADDEIFVSDGSKCDCGFILDILGDQNRIAITDPVYPVYVDTNVMAGHTGAADEVGALRRNRLSAVPGRERFRGRAAERAGGHHLPLLPEQSDRRGRDARRNSRRGWTTRCEHKRDPALRRRLRGLHQRAGDPALDLRNPGRAECAIEFRSFSKNGGFTGVRCGFTVMPKGLLAQTSDGRELPLHPLWHRRWSTKVNGVSYPVQRGAEALYSPEGRAQVRGADRSLHGQRAHPARGGDAAPACESTAA